jgi:hypothetical protein
MHARMTSTPTDNISAEGNLKVSESGEFETLRTNAVSVDRDLLEYVRRQMGRKEITGEMIGNAILFEEEMHLNFADWEKEIEEMEVVF